MSDLTETLSSEENFERTRIDAILRKGAQVFLEVGAALAIARDSRLYRNNFKTFEDYAASFGISRETAYKFIRAAKTVKQITECGELATSLSVDQIDEIKGASANALLELSKLDPAEQVKIAKEIVKANRPLTATAVKKSVAKSQHKSTKEFNPCQEKVLEWYSANKSEWRIDPRTLSNLIDSIVLALK